MGVLIPDPIIIPPVTAGTACQICWGPGKPFGDGFTPSSIIVTFEGIEKGPAWQPFMSVPKNGRFELQQGFGTACGYRFGSGNFQMDVGFAADKTFISLIWGLGGSNFFSEAIQVCQTLAVNEITQNYKNGTAVVSIPEVIL